MTQVRRPLAQRLLRDGPVRATLRDLALTTLGVARRRHTAEALRTPRVQNLYLHFLPSEDAAQFRQLVTRLSADHTFVPYSQAVARAVNGPLDRPYLSFSFDDGFATNLRAAEILAEVGISACFFVFTGWIGLERGDLLRTFPTSLGDEERTLTWSEVERLLELGHEIGSHTMDHRDLVQLPLAAAVEQIERSKAVLESRIGPVDHFAWPNGQFHHFSAELARATFAAGYASCASAVRGAHVETSGRHDLCVRRDHVVSSWPTSHVLYLLGRGVAGQGRAAGQWPTSWGQV